MSETAPLTFYCDNHRHLICYPYSIPNLHTMAKALGIKRCWFHPSPQHHHYDIPKRRIAEIQAKCTVVDGRKIVLMMRGEPP